MRIERLLWGGVVLSLLVVVGIVSRQKSNLEHAFLAHDDFRVIATDAMKRFTKYEGVNQDEINKSYYVSYAIFMHKTCIRFIVKHGYGVDTTYCYPGAKNATLVGFDGTGR